MSTSIEELSSSQKKFYKRYLKALEALRTVRLLDHELLAEAAVVADLLEKERVLLNREGVMVETVTATGAVKLLKNPRSDFVLKNSALLFNMLRALGMKPTLTQTDKDKSKLAKFLDDEDDDE